MIEIQSRNDLNKEQYNELSDRIMCGQLYQQNTIDRAKGIIAKPMPEEWYSRRSNVIRDEDSDETIQKKNFDMSIVADRKPYFMIYVYPHLKKEYDTYTKNADFKSTVMFGMHLEELASKQTLTKDEKEFIDYYKALMPVGINPCVVNRISWIFQNEFNGYLKRINSASSFDYNILKSDTEYSQKNYNEIKRLFKEYLARVDEFRKKSAVERIDDAQSERRNLVEIFKKECELICTNEDELCNIVLDICYKSESSKQFAWDICGNIFIKNLLKRNNYSLSYPEINNDGEFNYMGYWFTMVNVIIDKEEIE